MQHIDLSARDPHRLIFATLDASFADPLAQPPANEDEASFELPAPDLAHRLGLIAVERAVRRSQPRRMA